MRWLACSMLLTLAGAAGCGDDGGSTDAGGGSDAGPGELCDPPGDPDPGSCTPMASDYSPGPDDEWPACVSDDGRYHRIQPTISSIARVMAFEEIGELLFDPTTDPASADFVEARMIYQEDEGIDSRVVRRYDPHFDVPDGTDCTADGVPETYPDYCVGPAQLQPIVLDAFAAGIDGMEPRVSAARIEAALLWFFYASHYKEGLTCTTKAKDCDSAYAYYTGGEPARCGIGLARNVNEADPHAHDRAWDGLLAVRCWRDLDDGETAMDTAMRDRARDQYDRAVLDGVAAIVRDRLEKLAGASGDEQAYYHAFVQVLGQALDRHMSEASASDATTLRDEIARDDSAAVDTDAAIAAIDAVFECP